MGPGVYVDDVEAELRHPETFLLIAGSIVVAFELLLSYWMARSINSSIQQAATQLVQLTDQTSLAVEQLAGASQSAAEALSRQGSSLEQT